jgi:NAD(P)-dependent dehydrogenase (short-subunit alcohol dehydrogenase family)
MVTGAGAGIARATALMFAREGARVLVAKIDPTTGAATTRSIEAAGGQAIFVWMGKPDEIAIIAVFLASDESRMITGTTIPADGGRSAYQPARTPT